MGIRAIPGIYEIINIETWKRYVGSSQNLAVRLRDHRSNLVKGIHDNPRLQAAWNKYGEEKFVFRPLAYLEGKDRLETEQRLLDRAFQNREQIYNCSRDAKCPTKTPEISRKISESKIGKPRSDECKRKLSLAATGKHQTEESKRKISLTLTGKVRSDGHCKRLSVVPRTEAWKRNISLALTGKVGTPHTEVWKKKISLSLKRYHSIERRTLYGRGVYRDESNRC